MKKMDSRPISLLFFVFFFASASSVCANSDDEYWEKKKQEAREIAMKSYIPDPFSVTNSFNQDVHKASTNKTRRSLGAVYTGTCKATNPIDRAWRCRADWANTRQKLANCAKGFGRKAYGAGKKGKIYTVTDSSDEDMENPKPGTLRWAVIQPEPLWIVFERDMVIRLKQELIMTSWKTIDGRGAKVEIAGGAGLTIQAISNVIIHGIHIYNIKPQSGGMIRSSLEHSGERGKSDGDGISVMASSNVWIDHLTMRDCEDGLIDVNDGSTAITVSNCFFTQHNHVMLLGSSDLHTQDKFMQVTVAFNHFGPKLVQRMPRARFGFVHIVNNDYTEWGMYAIGGGMHPTMVCQGNRFTADPRPFGNKEVTKRDQAPESEWMNWNWTSEDDLFLNGAYFRHAKIQTSIDLKKPFDRFQVFRAKPGSFAARLTRYAGALSCRVGVPC